MGLVAIHPLSIASIFLQFGSLKSPNTVTFTFGPGDSASDAFTVVAFTPDGKQVLSVGHDKHLRYWSVDDGKELKKIGPMPDDLFGLAISRDGKKIATSGYGASIRVYEIGSGKELFNTHLKKMVTYCVSFTPDGKALVTGHEKDNAARVIRLEAKK